MGLFSVGSIFIDQNGSTGSIWTLDQLFDLLCSIFYLSYFIPVTSCFYRSSPWHSTGSALVWLVSVTTSCFARLRSTEPSDCQLNDQKLPIGTCCHPSSKSTGSRKSLPPAQDQSGFYFVLHSVPILNSTENLIALGSDGALMEKLDVKLFKCSDDQKPALISSFCRTICIFS